MDKINNNKNEEFDNIVEIITSRNGFSIIKQFDDYGLTYKQYVQDKLTYEANFRMNTDQFNLEVIKLTLKNGEDTYPASILKVRDQDNKEIVTLTYGIPPFLAKPVFEDIEAYENKPSIIKLGDFGVRTDNTIAYELLKGKIDFNHGVEVYINKLFISDKEKAQKMLTNLDLNLIKKDIVNILDKRDDYQQKEKQKQEEAYKAKTKMAVDEVLAKIERIKNGQASTPSVPAETVEPSINSQEEVPKKSFKQTIVNLYKGIKPKP